MAERTRDAIDLDKIFPALSSEDKAIEAGFDLYLGAGKTRDKGEFGLEYYLEEMFDFIEEQS